MVKRKAQDPETGREKKVVKSLADLESEDESEVQSGSSSSEESVSEASDDEEVEEMEVDGDNGTKQESEKPQKPQKHNLTAEEVKVARETSELFKSNVFKLQIDELMQEIRLSKKDTESIDKMLYRVNEILSSVGDNRKQYSLSEAEKLFKESKDHKISIPFPDPKPPKEANYKFAFFKPYNVTVTGSYALKTAVHQPEGVEVDLLVYMPAAMFQEKDYLNYRYFYKRAFYLACVARELSRSKLPLDLSYAYFKDDALRPVLKLTPSDGAYCINVHLGLEPNSDLFKTSRLSPDRNCLRTHADSTKEQPATPLYNSTFLSELAYEPYLKYLLRASRVCAGFTEACQLGRLWLRQRGFGSSLRNGGFGHFEWAMLMASLVLGQTKVLSQGYSSYQLFKATLRFLATGFPAQIISFSTQSGAPTKVNDKDSALDFESLGPVAPAALLYDRELNTNILYKVSQWSAGLLKHEAAITTDLLADVVVDRFESIFLRDLTAPHLRFDTHFSVSYKVGLFVPSDKVRFASYRHYFVEKLYRALSRGFGDRIKQIAFKDVPSKEWAVSKRKPSDTPATNEILVGLILDPQECDKLITHGPSADDEEEATRFQQFWGKISELRRFQDGRIAESVVWTASPSQPIVHSIAEHLLDRHFKDSEPTIEFHTVKLIENYLPLAPLPQAKQSSLASNALFQAKYSSFLKLQTKIQALKELPLQVRSVQPTSASLRFTSLHQPVPFDLKSDDAVGSGVIEFETSNRWPDELAALEKTKIAFLLKLSEQLEKSDKEYTAFVGVEDHNSISELQIGFLQVQTPDGYIFKLRVATDRDELLYNRIEPLDSDRIIEYKRNYNGAVLHNRTIHRLALRFPYYSSSARLLKRWFSAHLLCGQISEEAIELIALKPFLDSAPYLPPASASAAFYRAIDYLSRWDWRSEALVLDVEKAQDVARDDASSALTAVEGIDMDMKTHQDLIAAFNKHRSTDPLFTHAPLFIGTVVDITGTLWSQVIPKGEVGRVACSRMTALSRAVKEMANSSRSSNIDMFFAASLSDYHFVIHTNDPHGVDESKSKYKNLMISQSFPELEECVDVTADVVDRFSQDLVRRYRDAMVLFYSKGYSASRRPKKNVICGIWHKNVLEPRKFKVNIDYNIAPTENGEVCVNKDAILEEIKRMGGDLVSDIVQN
ncbi:U3 small nucleolar RNA-associated protein 22 [Trichomonascus vanleenenianus]|uniref:rRNA-processing protein UTP22 n=1 Tax=Trichomonascus vanleenenianus TaxID=2268995 RepID=UPI003ECA00A7